MNDNMQRPFFSVITPVYNCERYIKECIESVIKQTYSSWELILVDDGSTDASGNICDEFSKEPRIKVMHQENAGELFSRKNGIAIANGVYMLGLDADDYLDLNCLEILKQKIDNSGSDLIFYGYCMFGSQKGDVKCSLQPEKEYSQKKILEVVIGEMNHSLCNKAIRLDKVKLALNTKMNVPSSMADYSLIVPILCNIDTGFVIDDVLYHYRIYGESMSHTYMAEHIFMLSDVTEFVIQKLIESSLMDANMSELIYSSYLKMISSRLYKVFKDKSITKEDCQNIHKINVYIDSKKAETSRNFCFSTLLLLKMFRYRLYGILNMLI